MVIKAAILALGIGILGQTSGGGVDPIWIIVPSIFTFGLGVVTWYSNKEARKRENKTRELELLIEDDKSETEKIKTLLGGYEEQVQALNSINKDLQEKYLATQREVLELSAQIGKLEVKIHAMESEVNQCHAERELLRERVLELESVLGE